MADSREPETVVNLAFGSEGVTMGESGAAAEAVAAEAWDAGWKRYYGGERKPPLAYNKLAGYRNGAWTGMKTWGQDKATEATELREKLNSDLERDEDGNWPEDKPKPPLKEWMANYDTYKGVTAELEAKPLLAEDAKKELRAQ
jgi:hypothetical protein